MADRVRIVLSGRTGAGKSSLINALVRSDVRGVDIVPCTRKGAQVDWESGEGPVSLFDTRGLAEAGWHEAALADLKRIVAEAHLVLHVVGAPEEPSDYDRDFLRHVIEVDGIPIIVAANRIDRLARGDVWPPPKGFDPSNPRTDLEATVARWLSRVREGLAAIPREVHVVPVASGRNAIDVENQWGLDALSRSLGEHLRPDQLKEWVNLIRDERYSRSLRLILAYAVAAGCVGAVPVPVVPLAAVSALNLAMLIHLWLNYGHKPELEDLRALCGPAIAPFVGPQLAAQVAKIVPVGAVAGGLVSASAATGITYAMGNMFLYFVCNERFNPKPEEVRAKIRHYYSVAAGTDE